MTISNINHLHEIGNKKNQQDYLWPIAGTATPQDRIFIVCDGVGGAQNGEIASRMIADYMGNALKNASFNELSDDYITELLYEAKEDLVAYAKQQGLNNDMATTFSLLVLTHDKAFVAWCGDTRVYHVRDGKILYQTADHSLVQSLVNTGEITEEEAQHHPHKNIILNAIKADESVIEAEAHTITDLQSGDYFLLCTDGLLEQIRSEDLRVLQNANAAGVAEATFYFRHKCANKTRDNYSMYLLQVQQTPTLERNKRFPMLVLILLVAACGIIAWFAKHQGNLKRAIQMESLFKQPAVDTTIHNQTN